MLKLKVLWYNLNMRILSSASKVVFIMMASALIGLTATGIVEAKDFVMLATGVFGYYFGRKNDTPTQLG